jgi:hypothetical protein
MIKPSASFDVSLLGITMIDGSVLFGGVYIFLFNRF